ncbi:hypothetical protein DVB69_01320 [Sporosarcina sp. BI001-red]|uniref:hypothetical protein n=1 Tax=Sporosarcina sp. BI001-red TaxID=2282866 RepID=UPI000E263E32|nr:hypothetical protein [Sporosarcina sp. BI001-red]REB11007.1 hypothetical protein DVB69_01320 [Sporosarcina sp. BI001-red]
MATFTYLKKEKYTGEEVLSLFKKLQMYYGWHSTVIHSNQGTSDDGQRYSSTQSSYLKVQVAMTAINLFKESFSLKRKVKEKYWQRVFSGKKMYDVAEQLNSMKILCDLQYSYEFDEQNEMYRHQIDCMNILSPESHDILLFSWDKMKEGYHEIIYLLFGIEDNVFQGNEEYDDFIRRLKQIGNK